MRILITGNGFIANHLRRAYAADDTLLFTRRSTFSDVSNFAPDVIFHTAAALYAQAEMFNSNVRLTYDLLECTAHIDYKAFIYIGSSSEYGAVNAPISETVRLSPRTMYEATKGCGTLLCQAYARTRNKPIAVARPFSVYGQHDTPRKLIPTLLDAIQHNKPVDLVEDSVHDWLYIDDFVYGLQLLAAADPVKLSGDIVNFGTGVQTTNLEVLRLVEKVTGKTLVYNCVPGMRSYDSATSWVCDTTYAKERYGFEARYTLEQGLAAYVHGT